MKQLARQDSHKAAVLAIAWDVDSPQGVDRLFRNAWRVVPDPDTYEFVRTPEYQAKLFWHSGYFAGDCDDAATMGASILCALNQSCWLTAIRRYGELDYSHVYVSCLTAYGPLDIDPIVPPDKLPIADVIHSMRVDV